MLHFKKSEERGHLNIMSEVSQIIFLNDKSHYVLHLKPIICQIYMLIISQ